MSIRCVVCNKKVGLSGYQCACDNKNNYCNEHRYEWAHNCTKSKFDDNKKILEKNIIKVIPQKIEKI